jgi:hypothetical protein
LALRFGTAGATDAFEALGEPDFDGDVAGDFDGDALGERDGDFGGDALGEALGDGEDGDGE